MFIANNAFLMIPALALVFTAFVLLFRAMKIKIRSSRTIALENAMPVQDSTFSEEDQTGLIKQLKSFDLFERERSAWFRTGRITNVMRTMVGETEVFVFDYSYVVSSGKTTRTIAQTVFFANDKNWFLPNFILKPESWWHKIIQFFGAKDIDIPENPEFSDAFWLDGKKNMDDLIRQKFTPEVQSFLLERPPLHLEGNNYYLLAYKPGFLVKPEAIKPFFNHCVELTQLLQTEGKLELLKLAEIKPIPVDLPDEEAAG